MKKVFFRRGPNGEFAEFHTADDEWNPVPGQDIAFVDVIHGAGWVTVTAIRPIYSGSLAHTEIAALVHAEPNIVYLKHLEVFCEVKTLPGEPGYKD